MGETRTISRRVRIFAACGVAVVLVGGLVAGPGRPAVSALTKNFECFLPTGGPTIAALGDSITEGHHYAPLNVGADDSYADVLACESGKPVANFGVSGQTSAEILARVDDVVASGAETVLVLAGTNDVYLNQDTTATVPNLEAMRQRLTDAGKEPIFGLLPPSNHHPELVAEVNAKIEAWAETENVELVDYWTPLANPDGTFKEGYDREGDGLHPGEEASHLMAEQARSALS